MCGQAREVSAVRGHQLTPISQDSEGSSRSLLHHSLGPLNGHARAEMNSGSVSSISYSNYNLKISVRNCDNYLISPKLISKFSICSIASRQLSLGYYAGNCTLILLEPNVL